MNGGMYHSSSRACSVCGDRKGRQKQSRCGVVHEIERTLPFRCVAVVRLWEGSRGQLVCKPLSLRLMLVEEIARWRWKDAIDRYVCA